MSTPSQTVGPYLSLGLPWADGPTVVEEGTPGAVWIRGVVYDGAGTPVPDGLIETWQADAHGRFDHPDDPRGAQPGFRGFGRCPTNDDGEYGILTVVPGALPGEAPHINVSVFARGLLHRVVTRVYFPENTEANAADPVLASVPEERRGTLVARRSEDGYTFDVRLQGEGETVFFDV
ncbi:protocatechuate 3,4-dioxygenase subunit alpha [Prauserella coralliicola]|nr:protocatechuate 3,4-dioxygenase subunit alpha [Prauserella coralliicola]